MSKSNFGIVGFAIIGLAIVLGSSANAAANPIVVTPCGLDILLLAIFNLPINLLVLELVTYILMRRRGAGAFEHEVSRKVVSRLLYSGIIVSIVGGVVDLLFLYDGSSMASSDLWLWAIALSLVFLSIFAVMYLMVGTLIGPSILAGILGVSVNVMFWTALIVEGIRADIVWLSDLAAAIACVVLAIMISNWSRDHVFRPMKNGQRQS